MSERPVSQDLALVNQPVRADEQAPAPVTVYPQSDRQTVKPLRFAITPGKLREALLHRWPLALFLGVLLAAGGVGVAVLSYQPKYTAFALMRMKSSDNRLLPVANGILDTAREDEFRRTQAQWIKSQKVLMEVLKRDHIRGLETIREQEYPEMWLEKELVTGFLSGTDTCKIALSGERAEDITLIVNEVKRVYLEQFVDNEKSKQATRIEQLKNAVIREEEKIRTKKDQLTTLAKMHQTADTRTLTLKQQHVLDMYFQLKREFIGLDQRIRETDSAMFVQRANVKVAEDEQPSADQIDDMLDQHQQVKKEEFDISTLEAKIKEYGKNVTGNNAHLNRLESELKDAKSRMQKVRAELQPEVKKKAQQLLYKQRQRSLERSEEQLQFFKKQQEVVTVQLKGFEAQAEKIGLGSYNIELMRQDIEEADAIRKHLSAEKERLEVEKLNNPDFVLAVQPASIPTVNQASLMKLGAVYGLAGLALGLFGVSYLEARVRRVHKPADVHQELGIATLGVLPLLTQRDARAYGRAVPANDTAPGIMFTEAVNSLCASLLCDDRLCSGSVIMVTSASEHEGKTLLATQLAAGLARSGKKTLLLDGDLRNPRCHKQLGLAAGPGFSEVLLGKADLEAALQTLPESEARFLTAGQSDPEVFKALSNGGVAALLASLRKEFECIIIDSAPTLLVADGLLLGKLSDGVLLVVRPKISKATAVYAAYEQLASLKIRVLGAVVNANPAKALSRYYIR